MDIRYTGKRYLMASADKMLQQQLMEATNRLLEPPPSVDDLLSVLDQVGHCLSRVEQEPAKSLLSALAPTQSALVAGHLLRHSNVDVKVAVAFCISEITRITAPDIPYDDDKMKDVFQLIVSSFENLEDNSSRLYDKRTSILNTVATVRSCVVMLDLECDLLVIEMFQHFLKAIRDYHPEIIFSSMETIMTLVLEESDDVSSELLAPLLNSVKKGNEEVLPVAQKLGEKVLQRCGAKVKPYLIRDVNSLGFSLDDYSDIVASICQEISGAAEQDDAQVADGNKIAWNKNELRYTSKWRTKSQAKSSLGPNRAMSAPSTPDISLTHNDVFGNPAPTLKRPANRMAAKALIRKAKRRILADKQSVAEYLVDLTDFKKSCQPKSEQQFELLYKQEEDHLAILRMKEERKMKKEERRQMEYESSVMNTDTTMLNPMQAEYFESVQKEIMEKRRGKGL